MTRDDLGVRLVPAYQPARGQRFRWVVVAAIALLGLVGVPAAATLAEAPPLIVVAIDTPVRNTPSPDSRSLGTVPGNTQVELTGRASPGFLEIIWQGQTGWIPNTVAVISNRIGVDVAVANRDLPILDAPRPSANVRGTVPSGGTVILTGARNNGYVAMSYNGTGGWVDGSGLGS